MPIEVSGGLLPGEQPQITLPDWGGLYKNAPSSGHIAAMPKLQYEDTFTMPETGTPGHLTMRQMEAMLPTYPVQPTFKGIDPNPIHIVNGAAKWGSYDLSLIDPLGSAGNFSSGFLGVGQQQETAPLLTSAMTTLGNWPSRYLDYLYSVPAGWAQAMTGIKLLAGPAANNDGSSHYSWEDQPAYWQAVYTMSEDQLRATAQTAASQISAYPDQLAEQLFTIYKRDKLMMTGESSGNEQIDYLAKKNLSWLMDMYKGGLRPASGTPLNVKFEGASFQSFQALVGGDMRQTFDMIATQVPVVGTPFAKAFDQMLNLGGKPVGDDVEAMWLQLTPEQRRGLLQGAGWQAMGTNLLVTWPMLSGIGTVIGSIGRGAEATKTIVDGGSVLATSREAVAALLARDGIQAGIVNTNLRVAGYALGKNAPWVWTAYNKTLNVATRLAETSLGVMSAHFALETIAPSWYGPLGAQIDASQPVSGSQFSGLVNQIGYFTGLGGFNRIIGWTTRGAGGLVKPIFGVSENRILTSHFSGEEGFNNISKWVKTPEQVPTGAEPSFVALPRGYFKGLQFSTIESGLLNWVKRHVQATAEAMADGTHPATANIADAEERLAAAQRYYDERSNPQFFKTELASLTKVMTEAKRPLSPLELMRMSDEETQQLAATVKNARELEDEIARYYAGRLPGMTSLEAKWGHRLANVGLGYTPEGFRAYMKGVADRMGWQFDDTAAARSLKRDIQKWQQHANVMAGQEYHLTEAALREAIKGGNGLAEHPDNYFVMRGDHLFGDQAVDLRTSIDRFTAAETAPAETQVDLLRSKEEIGALIVHYVDATPETGQWYVHSHLAERGIMPADIVDNPAALSDFRDWMEHMQPMLNMRHVSWLDTADPEKYNLPVNTLARTLHEQGDHYAIAYKSEARNLTADVAETSKTAVRVSKVLPEGYTQNVDEVLGGISSEFPAELHRDGWFHVTVARDAVISEGLKTSADLPYETEGLGAHGGALFKGFVATTFDRRLAQTYLDSVQLAGRAARGEATFDDVLAAYRPKYEREFGAKKAAVQMREALGGKAVKATEFDTPEGAYRAVQRLDGGLRVSTRLQLEPADMGIAMLAKFEHAAAWDPAQIDLLEVAVRKGATNLHKGYDTGEVDFKPEDLWVVDHRAEAETPGAAGQGAAKPLPGEQPFATPVEDLTAPGTHRWVEHTYRTVTDPVTGEKTTQILDAPFLDYPLAADQIALGNRTMLGRKMDDIFMAWRGWKMNQYQDAQAQRLFAGTYEGVSSDQISRFIHDTRRLAAEKWSPVSGKLGKMTAVPLPSQAMTLLRSDEVQKIGESIFGKGSKLNRLTGQKEVPQYAEVLTDAFRQAYHLNLTAGVTSKLYSYGAFGEASILAGQWVVPVLRYIASPVFKSSELVESQWLNIGRGAHASPAERQMYYDAGLLRRDATIAQEVSGEPIAQGLAQGPDAEPRMPGAVGLDQLPGPFATERDVHALIRGDKAAWSQLKEDVRNPNPYKIAKEMDLTITLVRHDLPRLVAHNDPAAYSVLHDQLGVADADMARFIIEDRTLLQGWQAGTVSMDELTAHAAKYNPALADSPELAARMAEIYATPDWQALEGLLKISASSAQMEAFGVHYFGGYRSTFERSINHPLLGIYPASWAYKATKEWARFLYDNRMFGDGALRLGSAPAVVLASLTNRLSTYIAQNNGDPSWASNGPLSNGFFLFNLLLPGDWTSIPYPLSRSIRTVVRSLQAGQIPNPVQMATENIVGPNNRGGIGVVRDWNMVWNGSWDVYKAMTGRDQGDQWQNLVDGMTPAGNKPTKAPTWDELNNQVGDPFKIGG